MFEWIVEFFALFILFSFVVENMFSPLLLASIPLEHFLHLGHACVITILYGFRHLWSFGLIFVISVVIGFDFFKEKFWHLIHVVLVEDELFLNFGLLIKIDLSVCVLELPLKVEVGQPFVFGTPVLFANFALMAAGCSVMIIEAVVAKAIGLLAWWQVWLHHQVLAHWAFVLLLNFDLKVLGFAPDSGMAWSPWRLRCGWSFAIDFVCVN